MTTALFVGLTTLDLIYLIQDLPLANQKIKAVDTMLAAGGPATNAAVTFAHWGHQTRLLAVVGCHALTQLIRSDLEQHDVELLDLMPDHGAAPPVSSIMVTQATGERAVVSLNAQKIAAEVGQIPERVLTEVEVLLVDGHQMAVSVALAQQARALNIPVVLDGGSWKTGSELLLPWVDYAVCSADFRPPGGCDRNTTLTYLQNLLPATAGLAITDGAHPIYYQQADQSGWVDVPAIAPVDTLGAGDIFHGAFCHFILETSFREALRESAAISAHACQFFGTRTWLSNEGP